MADRQRKKAGEAAGTGFAPVSTKVEEETNRMLEATNPLRGLSAQDIENILDFALSGSISRLQLVYERLEASSLDIGAVLTRRESALVGCDWEIRQRSVSRFGKAGFDQALADEQQAMLTEQFSRTEDDNSLLAAIRHLQLAVFRGLSVVQPMYDEQGLRTFELYDAWNFAIDENDTLYWNPSGLDTFDFRRTLQPVPDGSVIKAIRKRPVDGYALPVYLRQTLGETGWAKFMARRGLPSCYIIAPKSLGNLSMDAFASAARKAADGGSGALPADSQVHTEQLNPGTSQGFQAFLDHQQKQIVLAATGGILGSLAEATGLGSGVAKAHEDTWREIIKADAFEISGLIQRSVGRRLLDMYFPGRPKLAYFAINADAPKDASEVLDCVVKANQAGLKVDPAQVEEMTGFKFVTEQPPEEQPQEEQPAEEQPPEQQPTEEQPPEEPREEVRNSIPAQEAAATEPADRTAEEKEEAGRAASRLLKGFDTFLAPLKAILSKLAKARDDEEAEQLVQDARARIALMEQQEDTDYSQAVSEYMDSIAKEEKDEQGA